MNRAQKHFNFPRKMGDALGMLGTYTEISKDNIQKKKKTFPCHIVHYAKSTHLI